MTPAEALLSGPRGRALCCSVLLGRDGGVARFHLLAGAGDAGGAREWLLGHAATADLAALSAASGELEFFGDLADVVARAVYWQRPLDAAADRVLAGDAGDAVRDALLPVAEAIASAPGTRWWVSPAAPDRQRYAQFLGAHPLDPPRLSGAARMLAAWRADTVAEEESARDRPADPSFPVSGRWWSAPSLSGLPVTTRALPGLGAARLALVEDALGWTSARCWPLAPRAPLALGAGVRVYEVGGPDAWAALVGRYPLDVSRSRRHDWWRATGRDGRWLIPDYAAVAADYDAVHVSVAGYLAAAGRALPAGDACTMLAGWDPDATWWLTDVLSAAGPPADWTADENGGPGWRPGGCP